MKINTKHPKFDEYRQKWQALADEMKMKLDFVENQNQNVGYHGRDDDSCAITKEYAQLFGKLREEYAVLYKQE